MNAIVRPLTPQVIEPAMLNTRLVSGVLPPIEIGGTWALMFYEERLAEDGAIEWLVVDRFAATFLTLEAMTLTMARACKCNLRSHSAASDGMR